MEHFNMYPYRPLSPHSLPSDRTPSQPFIDFFANETTQHDMRENCHDQPSHFDQLSSGRSPHSSALGALGNGAAQSSDDTASPYTIQRYLRRKGFERKEFLKYGAIQNRLDSVNLSAQTLLDALKIVDTANHPLLLALCVNVQEHEILTGKLTGIMTKPQGLRTAMKTAAQNCNNNPDRLITSILQHIRTLRQ